MLKVLTTVTVKIPVFSDMTVCCLVDLVAVYQITWRNIRDYSNLHLHARLHSAIWTESYSLQVLRKNKRQLSQACRVDFAFRMWGKDNSTYNFGYENHTESITYLILFPEALLLKLGRNTLFWGFIRRTTHSLDLFI
jgi:hypothetical protein